MKLVQLNTFSILAGVAFVVGAGGVCLAQSEPEEELEIIEVGDRYDEDDAASEDEIFDGMIFDQNSQQYRLIEDVEEDNIEEPPSPRETQMEEIRRLFEIYKESLTTRNFLEADTLAKQIIELSIRVYGIDSAESSKALTNLAIVQHNTKEYEAAERNYLASIDIIERTSDRLNEDLINPLKGLGATQLAMGRPDMARASLERAVHVSHVNEGPHNMDQVEVLESMVEIFLTVGEHKEALNVQERMYSIQARNLEPSSLDILPALKKQAHWQHRLQMYDRERLTWRKIVSVIERHHGKNDLRLIPPLTSLGKSYLYVTPIEYDVQPEMSVASGESYLRRANRIAEDNPDSTWQIHEQTLLALGDYYILSGRPNRASRTYSELWQLLSDGEMQLRNRRDHLERLNLLQDAYPPRFYRSERVDQNLPDEDDFEVGTVSFGYAVSAAGRMSNVVHIETRPPEFEDMSEKVRRSIRDLAYRPRLEEGKMVPTFELVYTHEFFYKPEDIPTESSEADSASR